MTHLVASIAIVVDFGVNRLVCRTLKCSGIWNMQAAARVIACILGMSDIDYARLAVDRKSNRYHGALVGLHLLKTSEPHYILAAIGAADSRHAVIHSDYQIEEAASTSFIHMQPWHVQNMVFAIARGFPTTADACMWRSTMHSRWFRKSA